MNFVHIKILNPAENIRSFGDNFTIPMGLSLQTNGSEQTLQAADLGKHSRLQVLVE